MVVPALHENEQGTVSSRQRLHVNGRKKLEVIMSKQPGIKHRGCDLRTPPTVSARDVPYNTHEFISPNVNAGDLTLVPFRKAPHANCAMGRTFPDDGAETVVLMWQTVT
jgi:hypothetical protein